MLSLEDKKAQISRAFSDLCIEVDSPDLLFKGKVRDILRASKNTLKIVTTDRVSAFDHVLGAVPLKGALLTEQSDFWFHKSSDIVKTHFLDRLDKRTVLVDKAKVIPLEVIVRGHLAGSLARSLPKTKGQEYGLELDPQMPQYSAFETPILTPTTKAEVGAHDAPLSPKEIVERGILVQKDWEYLAETAQNLFKMGQVFAKARGLILVDTKYEFGLIDGKIALIDEVHSADSSRYWHIDGLQERLEAGKAPKMLDKERLRAELLRRGYNPESDLPPGNLDRDLQIDLALHYWQLTETLLGQEVYPC